MKEDEVKILRGVSIQSMTCYGHKFTYAGEINGKPYLMAEELVSGKQTLVPRDKARDFVGELKREWEVS